MNMHNPPHPGEFISGIYLKPNNISGRELAKALGVAASTLSRVLSDTSRVTPEMALRLSKALGPSPESWLAMQDTYDLWLVRQRVDLQNVDELQFAITQHPCCRLPSGGASMFKPVVTVEVINAIR